MFRRSVIVCPIYLDVNLNQTVCSLGVQTHTWFLRYTLTSCLFASPSDALWVSHPENEKLEKQMLIDLFLRMLRAKVWGWSDKISKNNTKRQTSCLRKHRWIISLASALLRELPEYKSWFDELTLNNLTGTRNDSVSRLQ